MSRAEHEKARRPGHHRSTTAIAISTAPPIAAPAARPIVAHIHWRRFCFAISGFTDFSHAMRRSRMRGNRNT